MLEIKRDPKTLFDYQILQCLRECSQENMDDYKKVLLRMKQAKKNSNGEFGVLIEECPLFLLCRLCLSQEKLQQKFRFIREEVYKQQRIDTNDQEFLNEFNNLCYSNHSFNCHELYYNLIVCSILTKDYDEVYKTLKFFDNLAEGKQKTEIRKLSTVLMIDMKGKQKNKRGEQIVVEPFPVQNRLCSIFPQVVLPLSSSVHTRIFFCLPHVKKPDIVPRFQQKIFEEFNMSSIQIKPEAPWIRRSDQGVIFTDQVIKYDIQLSQSSSSEEQKTSQEYQEQDYVSNAEQLFEVHHRVRKQLSEEQKYVQQDEQDQVPANKMTGNQLRQFFKLDRQTEQRLAKINKK